MMNSLPWSYVPGASERRHMARRWMAAALHRASVVLARLARRLTVHEVRAEVGRVPTHLEFHAEAGAPEGALYVNGRLVGHLVGVSRL
jgi:hypothetical protein